MKIVVQGTNYISYGFKRGEERPEILPPKSPRDSMLRLCSHCKQRGVFEYT